MCVCVGGGRWCICMCPSELKHVCTRPCEGSRACVCACVLHVISFQICVHVCCMCFQIYVHCDHGKGTDLLLKNPQVVLPLLASIPCGARCRFPPASTFPLLALPFIKLWLTHRAVYKMSSTSTNWSSTKNDSSACLQNRMCTPLKALSHHPDKHVLCMPLTRCPSLKVSADYF